MRICGGAGSSGGTLLPGVALGNERSLEPLFSGTARMLLIVAHPIDYALFFSPTLSYFAEAVKDPSSQIYILSVTDGDRPTGTNTKDLIKALCKTYRVAENKLILFDSAHYRCGQKVYWDAHALRIAMRDLIIREKIQYVLTFDQLGVNTHKNHKYTSIAVQEMVICDMPLLKAEAGFKEAYELISQRGLMKYTSILGALIACCSARGRRKRLNRPGFSIMKFSHYKSMLYLLYQQVQLCSWQWLFVLSSSYSMYNEFIAIDRDPP